jgi:hypothetical protein
MMPNLRCPAIGMASLGLALSLAGCTSDVPTSDQSQRTGDAAFAFAGDVAVCHKPGSADTILEVPAPALAAHLAHGDYITTLLVSHAPDLPADGIHFGRISDALSAARAVRMARGELRSASCRITILVADGTYQGTAISTASGDIEQFPMIIDVPDITVRGALVMGLDDAGRATGNGVGTAASTLTPVEPMPILNGVSIPIIIDNAHANGSAGNGLVIEGFVFQSGHDAAVDAGGQAILGLRTTGLTIQGNRFESGFTESIDLRGLSGDVIQNHLSGTAGTCDICLAGPGNYRGEGNRLLAGGIPGITVDGPVGLGVPSGIEPFVLPATAETFADLENNYISDHNRTPVGVGIRLDALGVGGPNVQSAVHALIRDNRLVNNRFGIIIHAAFPVAGTALRGDIDATLGGNVIEQSCEAKLLVSFSRHTTALGLSANPYLHNSTFQLALGGDLDWSEAWFSDPDGFGNTLIVDGNVIPNGSRQFYDAAGCPGR